MSSSNDDIITSTVSREKLLQFWGKLEDLVDEKGTQDRDEDKVNAILVSYVKHSADSINICLVEDQDFDRMALLLVESSMWSEMKTFCISKLLSLLSMDMVELQIKFVIVSILFVEGQRDSDSLDIVLDFQGFTVFYNTLYTQFAYFQKYLKKNDQETNEMEFEIESTIIDQIKHVSTFLMDFLFFIFKYQKCQIANIQIIDDFFVFFILKSIRSDVLDDPFNNAMFKLILALNEEYIISGKKYNIENKIFNNLISPNLSTKFVELLLLKFNRMEDRPQQIMMCKVLYLILTCEKDDIAYNYFYLNDLNVFTDVLIRELQNISDNDEEILRNTFLRILIPLLNNTELSKTKYRKDDISQVLCYLAETDNICDGDTPPTAEQKETVRLANKCLARIKWLETTPPGIVINDIDDAALNNNTVTSILTNNINNSNTNNSTTLEKETSLKSLKIFSRKPTPPSSRNSSTCNTPISASPNLKLYNSNMFDSSTESLPLRKPKLSVPPPPPPSRRKDLVNPFE